MQYKLVGNRFIVQDFPNTITSLVVYIARKSMQQNISIDRGRAFIPERVHMAP